MGLVQSWNGGRSRPTGHVPTLWNGVDNIYVLDRDLMRLRSDVTRLFKSKDAFSDGFMSSLRVADCCNCK